MDAAVYLTPPRRSDVITISAAAGVRKGPCEIEAMFVTAGGVGYDAAYVLARALEPRAGDDDATQTVIQRAAARLLSDAVANTIVEAARCLELRECDWRAWVDAARSLRMTSVEVA